MTDILRVLYVDDEPGLVDISKQFLEQSRDLSVVTALSADKAFRLLLSERFDIIISDYEMPVMDGIRFLIEVRRRYGAVPFIIVTGRGSEEIAIRAFENGADFYLRKGGDPKAQFIDLKNRIQKAVEHRKTEMQVTTLNRLYSVLTATNTAITRNPKKSELLDEICRILIDIGGFTMAWAGLIDLEKHCIRLVASYGHDDGYLDIIAISTDNIVIGRSPTGIAYRERTFVICNDISNDPGMTPWREEALSRGYRSLAAFPFAPGTKNAGVITVYAPFVGFFTGKLINLLDQLAVDITFYLKMTDDQDFRKQEEEILRKSERYLKRAEEVGKSGCWELRLNEKIFLASDGARVIYGLEGTTWTIEEAKKIPLPEYRPLLDAALYNLITGKSPYNVEFKIRRPADDTVLDIQSIAEYDPGHNVIFGVIHDITELKQAVAALRESEEKFRTVFEYVPFGMATCDLKGLIISSNPAFELMLGFSKSEIYNRSFLDFTHPDDRMLELPLLKKAMAGEIASCELEKRYICKDGRVIQVRLIASLIHVCDGNPRFGIALIEDITQRKLSEEAFHQANIKLTLLSSITRHDINNQLTALTGYLSILERKQPDTSFTDYFNKINAAAERISAMIRFTKEYEEIGISSPVWQDCHILVDRMATDMTSGQVNLNNAIPRGAEVFADPLIAKVFYNLMDNAVRYGGKITTILFTVQESGDDWQIVCEDDGEGVPTEEKEKIFDRGFGKNTGLGLALSREILSITGITIRETGTPGRGARFEIAMPKGAWRRRTGA